MTVVLDDEEAQTAIDELMALDLQRHSHESLLERAWALRANVTTYDAVYVALAEALKATLLTCDGGLAKIAAGSAKVGLVSGMALSEGEAAAWKGSAVCRRQSTPGDASARVI